MNHAYVFKLNFLISVRFVRLIATFVACFGAVGIDGHFLSLCLVLTFKAS